MSMLNDGRNEIRFNNSDGKCLLENWVEEVRLQSHFDLTYIESMLFNFLREVIRFALKNYRNIF